MLLMMSLIFNCLTIYIDSNVNSPIIDLEDEVKTSNAFNLPYADFQQSQLKKTYKQDNITKSFPIDIDIGNIITDIRSLSISYRKDKNDDEEPLNILDEMNINIKISDLLVEKRKYKKEINNFNSQYGNITYYTNEVRFNKSIEDNNEFIYDINSYENLIFHINNARLMIKDSSMDSFVSFDNYNKINNPNLNISIDNIQIYDIFIFNPYFEVGGYLITRLINSTIIIWKIDNMNNKYIFSLYEKLYSSDSSFFSKITNIGIVSKEGIIIIGAKSLGIGIYKREFIKENPNQKKLSQFYSRITSEKYVYNILNIIESTQFEDFVLNLNTIYIVNKYTSLEIFDLKKLTVYKTYPFNNIKGIDHFEYSLNDYIGNGYYIGLSFDNNPDLLLFEFFIELFVNDEYNPEVNKVFTSKYKVRYDKYHTKPSEYSIIFDKISKKYIILYRGTPYDINIPTYQIPIQDIDISDTSYEINLSYKINVKDKRITNEGFGFIYRNKIYYLSNITYSTSRFILNLIKEGEYIIRFTSSIKCIENKSERRVCLTQLKKVYSIDSKSKVNGTGTINIPNNDMNLLSNMNINSEIPIDVSFNIDFTDLYNQKKSFSPFLIVSIIIMIISVLLIILIIYKRRKNNKENTTTNNNQPASKTYEQAGNVSDMKNKNEIEIEINHQKLDEETEKEIEEHNQI